MGTSVTFVEALRKVLGREPTGDEILQFEREQRLTNRPCENPLCDGLLKNFEARFCTRCWKAIETCRAVEAEWQKAAAG